MARGRIIDRKISTSKKVAKVSDKAALLYTWLISHTDDWGNMDGDASVIFAKVVPMRKGWSSDEVQEMLDELEEGRLILKYSADDENYVHILNFDNFQTFRSDRERKSEYPKPPLPTLPLVYQGDTTDAKRHGKLSEAKIREGEDKLSTMQPEAAPNKDIKRLIDFFHEATNALRGHYPPAEDGGKIGKLLKTRIEKDGVSAERIEKMIVWYLTRTKRDQDAKKNWYETFKNPAEFSVMLSNAYFSAMLTDESNILSYMADNFVSIEKIYSKIKSPLSYGVTDIRKLLADIKIKKMA